MGLCHNMNDEQCENDNGNNNESSDVMAMREREAEVNNEQGHHRQQRHEHIYQQHKLGNPSQDYQHVFQNPKK